MFKIIICIFLLITLSGGVDAKRKLPLAVLTFDGLHVSPDGQRYAADGADGTNVYKISEEGVVTVFATGFNGPVDITNDSLGNIYVTNFNSASVSKVTPEGIVTEFASTSVGPSGITIDENDNLYVAQYGPWAGGGNSITLITPTGDVSTYVDGDLIDTPIGITFDDEYNLIAANFFNGDIVKISPGKKQSLLATIDAPSGYAIGHLAFANGRLFATGLIDQVIYIVRKSGRVRAREIVKEGEYPNGIAHDEFRNEVIFTNTFAESFGLDRIRLPAK